MKTAPRLAIAALVASVVPPVLISTYGAIATGSVPSGLFTVAAVAWVVGLAHILLLGLPAFVYFLRRGTLSLRRIAAAGFVAGAVVNAFISYPRTFEGYSSGGSWYGRYVEFYVNGQPTQYAWFAYVEGCAYIGIYGLLTAFVAWLVWQGASKQRENIDI